MIDRATRAAVLLGAAAAIAGCGARGDDAGLFAAATVPTHPAELIAQSLAAADAAEAAGNRAALARAVRVLEASGARPDPESGTDDPLPRWRELAGVITAPTRGSPLGPGYRRGSLSPGESTRIQQLFLSGERARIAVSTPDGGPLTLHVRDARKDTVCDQQGTPSRCDWVPVFTARYSIEVANRGTRAARYYLVVE